MRLWKSAREGLAQGQTAFLALVAENTRHSPGTAGAKLLLVQGRQAQGTIGGGIMEHDVLTWAGEILQRDEFAPQVQELHHRRSGPGEKSGMICAGSQTNIYCILRPDRDLAVLDQVISMISQARPGHLLINSQGLAVREASLQLDQPPIRLQGDREANAWLYQEQLLNHRRVVVVGGGHCSLAVSRTLSQLGYHLSVFDIRPQLETLKQNEYADQTQVIDDYRGAGEAIPHPELTRVLVMTSDLLSDVRGLAGLAGRSFPFVGVMGSKNKIKAIFSKLSEEGIELEALPALRAPVGLAMKSNTPEEISISIAAQILRECP